MQEHEKIPTGWTEKILTECVDILDSRRVPVNSAERERRKGKVPYYGATGQVGWIDDHLFDEQLVLLGEDGAPFFDKSKPIAYIIEGKSWVNNHAHVLRARPGLTSNQYIKYFLDALDFHQHVNGTTRLKLTKGAMREISVRLPPFAEQKRIVAKVEELLARVNAARERLARVPAILKRFRQSVLAAACSGRLTADWREYHQDIESAKHLLTRIQEKRSRSISNGTRFKTTFPDNNAQIPRNWGNTTIGFLAEPILRGKPYVTSGSRGWAKYVSQTGPYFIRSENINTEFLRLEDAIHVNPPNGPEADRTRVQRNDLLLTITGNNVGRTAVVPNECPGAYVSQHVAIIRTTTLCEVKYLWLWVRSEQHGQKQLRSHFYGYTKPGLNLEQVKSVTIDFPPIEEQKEIVRRVEALFQLSDAIEKRTAAARQRVEKITQSILAKAFRGELVPTEAELARQEGRDYEPASVLLERIRAEREAHQDKKPSRQTKNRKRS